MNIKKILAISRPRFWVYLAGTYAVGVVAAIDSTTIDSWLQTAIWGAYFTLPANLLIYGLNDMFDYETDILNKKKQDYEQLLRPEERSKLLRFIAILHVPWLVAVWFLPWAAAWGLLLFWLLGIGYSVPPLRFKIRPLLDSVSNALYIMPGLLGFGIIAANFPPIAALAAGIFWCMAMHAYSAVPDITADSRAQIRTIATELGGKHTVLVCLAWYSIAAWLAWPFLGLVSVALGILYGLMMVATWHKFSIERTFKIYRWFPTLNTFSGMVIFLTALFQTGLLV